MPFDKLMLALREQNIGFNQSTCNKYERYECSWIPGKWSVQTIHMIRDKNEPHRLQTCLLMEYRVWRALYHPHLEQNIPLWVYESRLRFNLNCCTMTQRDCFRFSTKIFQTHTHNSFSQLISVRILSHLFEINTNCFRSCATRVSLLYLYFTPIHFQWIEIYCTLSHTVPKRWCKHIYLFSNINFWASKFLRLVFQLQL